MKEPLFTGVCTALVTPFLNEQINYPMIDQLVRRQIESGVKAIVLAGTTGEAPTLSDHEKIELFRRGKNAAGSDAIIIAGTGSNDTSHAVALSIAAQEVGADALLVVSPYYNKANEEGLYAHYLAIAHAVSIPIIVYNVPSRTGLDIPVRIYQRLSRIPNIAGVKEASTNISKIIQIAKYCGHEFTIWSGNDELTVPIISLGGKGVISVASNLIPSRVLDMTNAALNGDFDTASDLNIELQPVFDQLTCDINPIPIKAAMKAAGMDCGNCRLPLTKLSEENQRRIDAYFR